MVRSRKSAVGVVPRESKLAVLAFWKFLAAKAQILPPDNSLFLSPSHAHPLLGFKTPFQSQWYVCVPNHCIQRIEALLRAIFPLESISSQVQHPPSSIPDLNRHTPSLRQRNKLTLVSIVCHPQHQEPCSPPGPRPGPAHQARGQDRLWHLPA